MESAEIILTLNPSIEKEFIRNIDLEIEALQGDRICLDNGQVQITLTVGEEKAKLMEKLCLRFIAKTNEINYN